MSAPLEIEASPSARAGEGGAEAGPDWGLTALGPVETHRRALELALVLQSMGIWHVVRPGVGGYFLFVRDADYARAARGLDRYEEENRDWPPRVVRERLRYPSSWLPVLAFAALAVFYLVTGPVASGSGWFAEGRSVSTLVLGPEPWRAVTALTLHADGAHILGNAISGTVFTSALQRRIGPGGALLGVVVAGALGNAANALYHHLSGDVHASIGASTAVFAAIGMLAATQIAATELARARAQREGGLVQVGALRGDRVRWLGWLAPVVGGLALLGALGAGPSPKTDLWAHAFGLAAGLVVGLVATFALRRAASSRREVVQLLLGLSAVAVVVLSWELALRSI